MVEDIAVHRYQLLIEQLGEEIGGERWKSSVARELGISQPYVGMILRGERKPGRDKIQEAIRRKKLDPAFFFDKNLKNPHYRDFQGTAAPVEDLESRVEAAPDSKVAAYLDFLETELGQRLQRGEVLGAEQDAEILQHLDDIRWGGYQPTVETYSGLARDEIARRAGKGPPEGPSLAPKESKLRKLPKRGKKR